MTTYSNKKRIPLKALILAGGRGKRLEDNAINSNKCMLEFQKVPLIQYSLEKASEMNVEEIIIVVGHMAEKIINKYGNSYKTTQIKYAIQREQKGLVDAISCAQEAVGKSDFILLLGDEFFTKSNHKSFIDKFFQSDAFAVCGVIKVDDKKLIRKTYSILFDKESKRIYRLIEKPKNPINNIMGTGNIIFKNQIFDYIEQTPINQQRGEKELPDLVQCAIDDGKKIIYTVLAYEYVNVNTPKDITIIDGIIAKNKTQ